MIHYYVFKYWSKMLVGTMVGAVVIVLGLFSYSLSAGQQTATTEALNGTANQNMLTDQTYRKSVTLFGKIQELKVKQQDTTKLEELYTASVTSLSNQKPAEAEKQLSQLETQIAKINESLAVSPSPVPSLSPALLSGTPSPSIVPSTTPAESPAASNSAEPLEE